MTTLARKHLRQLMENQVTPAAFRQPRGWLWRAIGTDLPPLGGWRIEGALSHRAQGRGHRGAPHLQLGFHSGRRGGLRDRAARLLARQARHFQTPFKRFLRWFGGIPVDRSASHGVVGDCVKAFEWAPALLLALAPEGTRKGVSQWKTGFYADRDEGRRAHHARGVRLPGTRHPVDADVLSERESGAGSSAPSGPFNDVHGCRVRPKETVKD